MPSRQEALGLAILEGFSCGVPVVGSNVGEITNLLADNRGILVKGGCPKSLAEGIMRYIEDEDLRIESIMNARRYVEKLYSYEAIRDQFIKMLSSTVA